MSHLIPFDTFMRQLKAPQPRNPRFDRLVAIREAFVGGLHKKDGSHYPLEKRLAAFDEFLASPMTQAIYGDMREEYAKIPYHGYPLLSER